ncbi:MAG: hypothetical protein LBI63_04235 [Candidatus Ancillula sp.]|jgi:hypothetical protein|nr:hypothetical protein [Candidatus Ancillula sp.]
MYYVERRKQAFLDFMMYKQSDKCGFLYKIPPLKGVDDQIWMQQLGAEKYIIWD